MSGQQGDKALIATNTSTNIKTSEGILHRIIVGDVGSNWIIDVYDDPAANNNKFLQIKPTVTGDIDVSVKFGNGLRVVTSGTTPGAITVVFE